MTACRRAVRRCSAGAFGGVAAGLLLALGGCGGEGGRESSGGARGAPPENHDTPVAATIPHPSNAGDTTTPPPCPATGQWAECTVINRLEQAGLVMDPHQDPVTREPLQRQGRAFAVRSAELEVFIYPDRRARERDQARLDPDDYLGASDPPEPVHKLTVVASENLLVILDTRRERQRERITLALTAGPPQP